MKQFWTVFKFEFMSFMKNKSFVISTLIIALGASLLLIVPGLISSFLGSDNNKKDELPTAYYMISNDELKGSDEALKAVFKTCYSDYKMVEKNFDKNAIKKLIQKGDVDFALDITGPTEYTYYVDNVEMYDNNTQVLDEVMKQFSQSSAMVKAGVSQKDIQGILSTKVDHKTVMFGENQVQNYFYTYVMIMGLYMVIIFLGQMVANTVATEKSTRAMELLITSVKPQYMMFGKVLAACLAGFLELFVIFGSSLLSWNITKGGWKDNQIINMIFDMPNYLFVYMLLFFVLGFMLYAFLFAAAASCVSRQEDLSSVSTPVTLIYVFGFLITIVGISSGNVDTTIMKVCSMIPFTSPMAMFARISMSTVPVIEIAASIAILVVSTIIIGIGAAKIYRAGVTLYGNAPSIKKIVGLLKKQA